MKKIFFLHGWAGSGSYWDEVLQNFPQDYEIYNPTLPGHGNQPSLAQLGIKNPNELARYLCKEMPSSFATGFYFCGYSLGGRLALLATQFLQNIEIKGVILLAANLGLTPQENVVARDQLNASWMQKLKNNPQVFWEDWYSQPIFAALSASQRAQLEESKKQHNFNSLSDFFLRISNTKHAYLRPLLQKQQHLLYVAGELDKKYCALGQAIGDFHPQADIAIIPNASHALPVEQPQKCAQKILDWIEKRERLQ